MLYDKDIREPLFDFLEERYGKIRILEEKRMGRSRADLVMVRPESVSGIEIKSDADSYSRLNRQVKDYDQYYDSNYVVIGATHAMHIEEHVPNWWGIVVAELVDGNVDFFVLREAKENPGMDLKKKLSLLWRPELVHIQEINRLLAYREKSKVFVINKILQKVSKEVLDCQISEELFQRDYTIIEETIRRYKQSHKKVGAMKIKNKKAIL